MIGVAIADDHKVVRVGLEQLLRTFAEWPRQVQIERLLSTVDEVERGAAWQIEQGEAWLRQDATFAENIDRELREHYPALYAHLLVRRNERWVERIADMLEAPGATFILVGSAHLTGPASVFALLERAGIAATRA